MKKYIAYHFTNKNGILGYGDGRQVQIGKTLSVECTPALCEVGLHGSESIVDALGYAGGARLWKVEIWGDVSVGDDKLVGTHRKALTDYGEILPLIIEFAKWCADRAAEYAKYAKYAEYAKSAAKFAKFAKSAEYAAKSAKFAAEYAKSAKYAEYAKYAAKSAAKFAAEYAKFAAEYAAKSAELERKAQENWWTDKLRELK